MHRTNQKCQRICPWKQLSCNSRRVHHLFEIILKCILHSLPEFSSTIDSWLSMIVILLITYPFLSHFFLRIDLLSAKLLVLTFFSQNLLWGTQFKTSEKWINAVFLCAVNAASKSQRDPESTVPLFYRYNVQAIVTSPQQLAFNLRRDILEYLRL